MIRPSVPREHGRRSRRSADMDDSSERSDDWSEWKEAPPPLVDLLRSQAARNEIEIVRDAEVRLDCDMPDGSCIPLLIFWPSGEQPMNIRLYNDREK